MRLSFRLPLSPKLVRLAFRIFETPVEELVFGKSRIVEYSYAIGKLVSKVPGRALDAGCTYRFNYLTPTLAQLGWEIVGIDIREFKYQHRNFRFVLEDIRHTSFPDSCFDYAYCISTIEHIGMPEVPYRRRESDPNGDKNALDEIRRILKPSGNLLLTTEYGREESSRFLRVYNAATLNRLLSGWTIKDIRYYAQIENREWSQVMETEAAQVIGEPHAIVLCELSPCK